MNLLSKGVGVVGSTTIDKIITPCNRFLKLGGVTTYAGITYRRYDIPVFVVSNMAEHDLHVLGKLRADDILICSAQSDHSTQFVNYHRSDTRYQELLQQADSIKVDQVKDIVKKIDVLHLGPLHPHDIEAGVFGFLYSLNLKIFLDVQGYTRTVKNKRVNRSVSVQAAAGLSLAHIAKANGTECNAILAFFRMELAELMHYFNIEEFVVTLGGKGGFVQKRNGEKFHYEAAPVESPVDPTGAGDVFFAAYIKSRLADRKNIPEACTFAAKTAADQVAGKFITTNELSLE